MQRTSDLSSLNIILTRANKISLQVDIYIK